MPRHIPTTETKHLKLSPAEGEYGGYDRTPMLGHDSSYAIGQETTNHNLAGALALRRVVEKGFVHHLSAAYNTDVIVYPDDLWSSFLNYSKTDALGPAVSAYYEFAHAFVDVYFSGTSKDKGQIDIYADTKERAESILVEYQEWVPVAPRITDENTVIISFWNNSSNGPRKTPRRIEVPAWGDIKDNYAKDVADTLDDMTQGFVPSHGGQLILWHGDPGTGKTYALRALAREWRSWCEAEYIVDPEKFFGSDSDYLMRVLLADPGNPGYSQFAHLTDDDDDEDDPKERWRLLICEDTGELLDIEAKDRAGQGLSRLLNTVDGLIGQGLKILILITTNEKLPKLHAAVSRSGRAAVVLEFLPLGAAESVVWGSRHEIEVEHKPHRLADLYASLEGYRHDSGTIGSQVGFGRRQS